MHQSFGIENARRTLRGRWAAFAALAIAALLLSATQAAGQSQPTAQAPPRIVQVDARQNLNAKVFVRSTADLNSSNVAAAVNGETVQVTPKVPTWELHLGDHQKSWGQGRGRHSELLMVQVMPTGPM